MILCRWRSIGSAYAIRLVVSWSLVLSSRNACKIRVPEFCRHFTKGAELGGPFHFTRQSAFKQSNSFLLLRALRGTFLQENISGLRGCRARAGVLIHHQHIEEVRGERSNLWERRVQWSGSTGLRVMALSSAPPAKTSSCISPPSRRMVTAHSTKAKPWSLICWKAPRAFRRPTWHAHRHARIPPFANPLSQYWEGFSLDRWRGVAVRLSALLATLTVNQPRSRTEENGRVFVTRKTIANASPYIGPSLHSEWQMEIIL